MITVEDKIRTFSKYVYEKELNEAENIIKEAEEKSRNIIKEAELKAKEKCNIFDKKYRKKQELECQKTIAKAKIAARNMEFELKNKLMDELEKSIEQKLKEFSRSEKYEEWLIDKIKKFNELIENKDIIIYLRESDKLKFADKIKKILPKSNVLAGDENSIGGFIIENHDKTERIDYTFSGRLEENKQELGILFNEMLAKELENER